MQRDQTHRHPCLPPADGHVRARLAGTGRGTADVPAAPGDSRQGAHSIMINTTLKLTAPKGRLGPTFVGLSIRSSLTVADLDCQAAHVAAVNSSQFRVSPM
jgi:hypothetical protein